MRRIFFKLLTAFILVTSFLALFVFFFSHTLIKRTYLKELKNHLRDVGNSLMPYLSDIYKKGDYEYLDNFVKQMGNKVNVRITVIDTNDVPVGDSEVSPQFMENYKERPEVIIALGGEIGSLIRYSETLKEDMLYVALPIYDKDKLIGVLRTGISLREVNSLLLNLRNRIFYSLIGVLFFSWLIALLFSRRVSLSIREILNGFKSLSQGKFEVRLFTKRKDEIGELAREFNEMSRNIQKFFEEVKFERQKFYTLFHAIPQGIVLLDREGKIILFNNNFKSFFKEDVKEDRFYWEYIKSSEFPVILEKAKSEESFLQEMEFEGRIFLCTARKLSETGEVMAIFHDITNIKELEYVKKELTINITHELKTPLTAIKGFIETLEEEEEIKNKKYIEIIKKHIDRLINIVERVIYLSELEKKDIELDIRKVNIKGLIEGIVPIFEKSLKEKKIKLTLYLQEDLPEIKVDPFKMEQVFINLIDNAIKYTQEGEIKISAYRKKNNLLIEVEDTGVGIPGEHIPRIFERFYVVHKSRDKKKGGYGLGLSIVKHIISLHNGKIDVESEVNKGTKFIITLPI